MVCHETYRAPDGRWLLPEEGGHDDSGATVRLDGGGPVTVGRSEKMSKSRKNVVDPENIIESYGADRSEEHTSELQSLMRISYAVFCLKKKNKHSPKTPETTQNR